MLTMRPQKGFVFSLTAIERAYDILEGDKPMAVVTYLKNKGGAIALDGQKYPVVRGGGPSTEMLIQVLIRLVMGRKSVPATWTLTDPDGKTLASAIQSKQGIVVSRGEEKFAFRKHRKAGWQLFRAGSDQPLVSTKGMEPQAEFDRPFQIFVFALAIALAEEDVGGVDTYINT